MIQFDIESIEKNFFKGGNPLKRLLKISLDLFGARQTGILYGTNQSKIKFLPTTLWDRGVMDRFDGRGLRGVILKVLGTQIVTAKKLSPVFFFKTAQKGGIEDNDGIISYVLRNCADYYKKGISVIICPDTERYVRENRGKYVKIPFFVYDGTRFEKPEDSIKVDARIVRHFNSGNSIYIYLPDYGILVINTADPALLETRGSAFAMEKEFMHRLDVLIKLVETASLAYLGQLKGKKGAQLLWRKERHLRQTSQELIENEKLYRDLYENAPIAYISMDSQGNVVKCNQQAESLSGYERDDLIGRNAIPMIFRSPDRDIRSVNIRDRLSKGEPIKDMELQMKPKKGEPFWVSLSVDAVKNKPGRIVELRAMIMDISQRKGLERQLFQAQKMEAIGTLAGGIAHDFNNVLSPISGYTEMLIMDAREDDPGKKYLDVILDCVKHAKELVNQILTFSQQKEHDRERLRAGDTIEESVILVQSFLPSTIRVTADIDKECGYILADPVQIHRVIMNLVTNSFHAMEDQGGALDICLKPVKSCGSDFSEAPDGTGDHVCLTVKDSGTGIDPGILNKIFDPYFSTKQEGKGSGIGLSVVHGIVKSHGGSVRVESCREKGTCFYVYFPLCREDGDARPPEPDQAPIQKGTERILLVDDDQKVAIMETHMLEKLGYAVTCFTSSLAAADAFKTGFDRFDVVVTDMTMPDLTGIQFAKKVYGIRPDLPIILCTGFGDTIDKRKYELPSIKGFLKKPVAIRELSRTLRQVLD